MKTEIQFIISPPRQLQPGRKERDIGQRRHRQDVRIYLNRRKGSRPFRRDDWG